MKTFVLLTCTILFAIACKNPNSKSENPSSDSAKTVGTTMEELNYPYTLSKPYKDWQPGDKKNALMVMQMIKAWETKNIPECASYFADSVDFQLDYFHKVIQHDSIPKLIEWSWADYASVNIKMDDWESVISSDKKDEWVTLWYKQNWIDKKGKADSLNIVNDVKILNGKIVVFDEKIQHFPTTKK
ncbi:hypothetical protein SAMN05518672_102492 [Chitinophaga sp. CF118]|uniref:hypothetical protein n=1 Tax=Chitinophaga sp. CF118 TaxID=1884367 RepID=UPI0008F3D69B|nr:hypothetical protein [Chitinophaga sp. CF118]SFD58210.1 hypothetical protein SAMN05518672_102492 [Chitinophaga sp. CF118]